MSTPKPPRGPVVVEYDEEPRATASGPAVTTGTRIDDTVDPAAAPPVPEVGIPAPEGRAMTTATRIAARRMGWFGRLAWGAASGLVMLWLGTAAWDFALGLLARNTWLGYAAMAMGAVVLLALLGVIARELAGFARLTRLDAMRKEADAARAIARPSTKVAETVVADMARLYRGRDDMTWHLKELEKDLEAAMDGVDRLDMAERILLAPLDAAARKEVEAASRQVAAVTAIVPLALADVFAALTSNVRMVRRIAEIYGGRAGTLGSWRLIKAVASHLIATGAVGVADDMISSVAGGGMLSKVSRRFGEGVINGALTARVGVAAMDVCRPMPFHALEAPSVTGIVRRAMTGMFAKG